MRIGAKHALAGLAVLAVVMPVWARVYKQPWIVSTPSTIGSMQVKAGEYQLNADDAKKEVMVLQNNKVVATVTGQWTKLPKKAEYSTVLTDGNKVTQIEFDGSDQAFQPQ
jgi:hypothetical protein